MFPPPTPVGPPEMWIDDDLKQFLIKVNIPFTSSVIFVSDLGLKAGSPPKKHISREELVQKVRAIIDNQKTVAT